MMMVQVVISVLRNHHIVDHGMALNETLSVLDLKHLKWSNMNIHYVVERGFLTMCCL